MKFASTFAILPLVLSRLASAHPVEERSGTLEERQSTIVITSGASNGVLPRLEIRQLQATKPNQWSLFILAMQKWQNQSQAQPWTTSYFGISKIHGVPEGNYNNVPPCSKCNDGDNTWGYCTHNNVLFPAWHRVYMALFEQEFLKVVQSLVTLWPASQQATIQTAANQMRFPYWDWAALPPNGGPTIPTTMTSPNITFSGPNGTTTIANPLYQITINDPSQMYYPQFDQFLTTIRYPNATDSTAVSQEQMVIDNFNSNRQQLQSSIYQLLTGCSSYLSFSNFYGGTAGGCQTSLEYIHNMVHNLLGGSGDDNLGTYGGNMAILPEASFDPAFWLHHAMVDRIFAMWQTLHPNAYGASQTIHDDGQTWTIPKGSTPGADSNLTPFYKDNGKTFWTTNLVRNWSKTFNYTYAEYTNSDGSQKAINSYVSKLYGPSATATAGSSKRTAIPEAVGEFVAEVTSGPVAPRSAEASENVKKSVDSSSMYQWNVNIKTTRWALDGNYQIYLFLSNPSTESPVYWMQDPAYAGFAPVLMAVKNQQKMSTNINNDTQLITAAVPINSGLQKLVSSGKLASLDPTVVTPYLAKNLQWRVVGRGGQKVATSEIPGLLVAASSTQLQVGNADAGELPVWSNFQVIPQITKDKVGGLNNTASYNATTVGQIVGSILKVGITDLLGNL